MITGDLRSQIDSIWNTFWTGGISNPLEVIEQITYLLFLRRLDDLHTLEENKAARTKRPRERRVFPEGKDKTGKEGRSYEDFRWSRFKHFEAKEMYELVGEHVFPWLRTGLARNGDGEHSTYAHHMKDARFTIPTCRWRTATPRATFTSTCSARSPPPGRMGNSARRAISSA